MFGDIFLLLSLGLENIKMKRKSKNIPMRCMSGPVSEEAQH